MDSFIGTITAYGFNFAPYGWAFCQGQLMSISQNTALFSLLGTNYGGDGKVTFGLPNLVGKSALGAGTAVGGDTYVNGETGGQNSITLNLTNLPMHNHTVSVAVNANARTASATDPTNNFPAPAGTSSVKMYAPTQNAQMKGGATITLQNSGGTSPVSMQNPYLVCNYSICLQGIFPQRP